VVKVRVPSDHCRIRACPGIVVEPTVEGWCQQHRSRFYTDDRWCPHKVLPPRSADDEPRLLCGVCGQVELRFLRRLDDDGRLVGSRSGSPSGWPVCARRAGFVFCRPGGGRSGTGWDATFSDSSAAMSGPSCLLDQPVPFNRLDVGCRLEVEGRVGSHPTTILGERWRPRKQNARCSTGPGPAE